MMVGKAAAIATLTVFSMACVPAADKAAAETDAIAKAPPPELFGECDAKLLSDAIGQKLDATLQAKLKKDAKAGTVRVAAHDGPITMDYSPSRLNIFVDDDKKIVRIDCG